MAEVKSQGAVEAMEVAERLRLAIKVVQIPLVGSITVSVGIAEAPFCAQTTRDLLASADAALYTAKQQGRDRIISGQRDRENSLVAADVQSSRI